MRTALAAIDLSNDFTEDGGLAVTGGDQVARSAGRYIAANRHHYSMVVASLDWHIEPGRHWAASVGETPDFVDTWTIHCVAGTAGAAFDDELILGANEVTPGIYSPYELFDAVVYKGQYDAAYSAFEGSTDPMGRFGLSLDTVLRQHGIEAIDFIGIAEDHCIRASALDAVTHGYAVRVIGDLTVFVAEETAIAARAEMTAAGIMIATTADLTNAAA